MKKLKVLDLFSGIGGFSLGLERTGGFETIAFCEIEPFPRRVLAKHWPKVPCYNDVKELTADRLTADGIAVDAICGGFPCQDISVAGRMAGIEGERSGLWREYVRLIGELRPAFVIMENVTGLLNRGLDVILGALAKIRYDAVWHCIRASRFGLGHKRDRLWILAYPSGARRERFISHLSLPVSTGQTHAKHRHDIVKHWLQMVVDKCGVRSGDGVSVSMERRRIKALGNAVVPQIPELIGRAILAAMAQQGGIAA